MRRILNNWKLKLLAVGLATLTYYVIRGKTNVEVHYELPLKIQVEDGIAVLDQDPRTVHVTFRGSQQDLRNLDQSQLRAVVKLKATNATGSEEVSVGRRDIEGAAGVTAVEIRPARATVMFDLEVEKKLPVARPAIKGRPLQGRVEMDYEPKTVSIRGPRRRLVVAGAFTEPVDVEGRMDSFASKVRVLVSDPWITDIKPPEVTVTVNIIRDIVTRTWVDIPVLPLADRGAVGGIVVEPPRIRVKIQGQAAVLDSIAEGSVRAFVDCVGLARPAQYNLPVNVHIPSNTELQPIPEPSTVKVILGTE